MSLDSLPLIRREPVKQPPGTVKPRPSRPINALCDREKARIVAESKRLGLTRDKAAEVFGISRSAAERLLAGIDTRRGPRTGHVVGAAERARIRAEVARSNMTRAEAAVKYNLTRSLIEDICHGLPSARTHGKKITVRKCDLPTYQPARLPPVAFTRVRFVGGGTLTVSHGQGEEYAASMVEAMTAGREVASVEVVK